MKTKQVLNTVFKIPRMNETYYYITVHPAYGNFIVQATTWRDFGSDKRRLVKGNVYESEIAAMAVADNWNLILEEL